MTTKPTKQQQQKNSNGISSLLVIDILLLTPVEVAANSGVFRDSLPWLCVVCSKFDRKITQPVNNMYQDYLYFPSDLGYISTYV
jgi:hypothetical protein